MLPLFGRTRKTAVVEIPMESIDEWCVPSDSELYGRSKTAVIERETEKKDDISNVTIVSGIETTADITNVNDITTVSEIMSVTTTEAVTIFDEEVPCNSDSFQCLNTTDADADDVVVMSESEINFSNETFSIMNNETTIVDTSTALFPTENAFKTVLERLVTLERQYETLNSKVIKMEESAQKGNSSDSNASIFVNEFVGFMQDVMKTGLSYQQQFLGKFIDELDGMFDFDFTDFDPLK